MLLTPARGVMTGRHNVIALVIEGKACVICVILGIVCFGGKCLWEIEYGGGIYRVRDKGKGLGYCEGGERQIGGRESE